MSDDGYKKYWAIDVVKEMGHDERDVLAVNWVLRWMERYGYNPEEESVVTMSDKMKEDFERYLLKRSEKRG